MVPQKWSVTDKNFCHFEPFLHFYPLKNKPKNQNFEKMKNYWRYYHFTQVYHKLQSYNVWFLRYGAWQTFVSFWTVFCPLTPPPPPSPLTTRKIKTLKKWKKLLEILSFYTFVSQWQSYDIWLLRYQAQQTEFFVILDHFLPFYNPKNQNFKNLIKSLRYHRFTQMYQKSWSNAILFLRYGT